MTGLNTVMLSSRDRETVTRIGAVVARRDVVTETEAYVVEAQIGMAALSTALRRTLIRFRRFGNPSGGLLVRGVPLGWVPPTPRRTTPAAAMPIEAAASMSVLIAGLGEQYGFRPEHGGRIIQNILPVHGFETEQMSVGSTVDLECHVETAFSPYRADYVTLLCLRQDHDRIAGTTISSIDRMLPLLDAATIQTLREARFRTKVDASFRVADDVLGDLWVHPICVLDGPWERPHLRVDFAETEATDATARAALGALADAAQRTRTSVRLRAGDLLIVDNHRAVHGRTHFAPRYDGADRWLLRSFIAKDLRSSERVRNGDARIVEPDYFRAGDASGAPTRNLGQAIDHPTGAQLRAGERDQVVG